MKNERKNVIEEIKVITALSVRNCCIDNNLYTLGDSEEYANMLEMVRGSDYSLELLLDLAIDIVKHSEDQTIENVMFLLNRHAVGTFYKVYLNVPA